MSEEETEEQEKIEERQEGQEKIEEAEPIEENKVKEQVGDESGLELDLKKAEEISQGSNFKSFMQPKIIAPPRAPSLDRLIPPQQGTNFDDMLGNKTKKKDEKDKKSVMNYDIQPLGVNPQENYIPRNPAGGQTAVAGANIARVDLQTIGKGRLRVGSEFDVKGFQEMATQGMKMAPSDPDYKMKAPTSDEIKDRTVFDNQPGFKPKRDYKA